MTRLYSMALRERAMDRLAVGETSYEVSCAEGCRFQCDQMVPAQTRHWQCRAGEDGRASPFDDRAHRDWVLSEVERMPHVTIAAFTAGLAARGLKVHPASAGRFLHREGKSFKKTVFPAEQLTRPALVR